MERYLVNIKIENNCFYLFFNDDTIKKIDFTNQNFKSLLNYYSNHEYFYKNRINDIKFYIYLNKIILTLNFLFFLIALFTINQIITIIIISILLLNISTFNLIYLNYLNKEQSNITNLINIINNQEFINNKLSEKEKKMIRKDVIDLDLYKKIKLYHEIYYNFQDYNTNTSNNLSNTDKTKGKILEFKRK